MRVCSTLKIDVVHVLH